METKVCSRCKVEKIKNTNIRPRCSYLNRTLDNKKYKII